MIRGKLKVILVVQRHSSKFCTRFGHVQVGNVTLAACPALFFCSIKTLFQKRCYALPCTGPHPCPTTRPASPHPIRPTPTRPANPPHPGPPGEGRQHGAGAASLRRERDASTARERRHPGHPGIRVLSRVILGYSRHRDIPFNSG